MKKILCFMFICFFYNGLFGQEKKEEERKKINNLFYKMIDRSVFKDTTMVYMFAFKVKVSSIKGVPTINEVNVSDSSAHLIYKNFNFLKEINYKLFMQKRKKATFLFPVSIFLSYPDKLNSGSLNEIDLQKKIEKLWFRTDFSASPTENFIYIPAVNLRTSTVSDY